jgi:hypothetical protein
MGKPAVHDDVLRLPINSRSMFLFPVSRGGRSSFAKLSRRTFHSACVHPRTEAAAS